MSPKRSPLTHGTDPAGSPRITCVTCRGAGGEVCVLSSLVGEQLVRRQDLGDGAYKILSPSPMLDPRVAPPDSPSLPGRWWWWWGGLTLLENLLSGTESNRDAVLRNPI